MPSLDGVRTSEPPDVVTVWILEPRERHLCSFPIGRVNGHPLDKRRERAKVVTVRRGSETVIQRVLAERALRPIDSCKHFVQIQINPSPLVEGAASSENRGSGDVRLEHDVHPTDAIDRRSPRGANSRKSLPPATKRRHRHEYQESERH
jgi:hypothetical protein